MIALSTPPYYDVGADNYVQTRIQIVYAMLGKLLFAVFTHMKCRIEK